MNNDGARFKDIILYQGSVYKPIRLQEKVYLVDLHTGQTLSDEPLWVNEQSEDHNPLFDIAGYLHSADYKICSNYNITYWTSDKDVWHVYGSSRHKTRA